MPSMNQQQRPHTSEKRIGRRTWRAMGIRLNTESMLSGVTITDQVLGSGSFGAVDVRVALWCGARVAAKSLQPPPEASTPPPTDESSLDLRNYTPYQRRVLQECQLMGQLRHPHIAQLLGVFIDSNQRPVIICELLHESLAQRFAFGARYTFRDVMDISAEVLSGLVYLHMLPQPVVHGSLCSANVLLTVDGTVKLTDANFALAKLHVPATPTNNSSAAQASVNLDGSSAAVSPQIHSANAQLYQPAEALRGGWYDVSVDSFSFSVLLMALALHREPCPSASGSASQSKHISPDSAEETRSRISESERRVSDLADLKESVPILHSLVSLWIDDNVGEMGGDSMTGRLSTTEQLRNVNEVRRSDAYIRWPSTRGSPFAQGLRRRQELETAVRQMEAYVKEAVEVAMRTVDKQRDEMLAQLRELTTLHVAERTRLRRLLDEARRDVQSSRRESTHLREDRREILRQRDALEARLETLRAESTSPRTASRKYSMPDDLERDGEHHRDGEPSSSLLMVKALRLSESSPGLTGSQYLNGSSTEENTEAMIMEADFTRELTIKMPDNTLRMFPFDDRQTVSDIVQQICDQQRIPEWEAYSLLCEEDDTFNELVKRVQTRNRRSFRDRKLEMLKKRQTCSTPEPLNWLIHDQTLRQQGVDPCTQVLTLRKKLTTFSDVIDDENDPERIEAKYSLCKEDFIEGRYLCSVEEACGLAALMAQVHIGNYNDIYKTRMKNIHEEVKDFLPKCHQKNKAAVKRLLVKYSESSNSTALLVRQRFIQACHALPMYGASVFLVKERMKTKSRGCILGVTAQAVLKVDEKTKDVQEHWPLHSIRRYKVTGDLLTLDVSENREPVLIVSSESQAIANVISSYMSMTQKREAGRESVSTPPMLSPGSYSVGSGAYDEVDMPLSAVNVPSKFTHATRGRLMAVRRTESAMVLRNLPRLPLQAAEAPAIMGSSPSDVGELSPPLLQRGPSSSTGSLANRMTEEQLTELSKSVSADEVTSVGSVKGGEDASKARGVVLSKSLDSSVDC